MIIYTTDIIPTTLPTPKVIRTKPQVHSRRLHLTYNACAALPLTACVRARTPPATLLNHTDNDNAPITFVFDDTNSIVTLDPSSNDSIDGSSDSDGGICQQDSHDYDHRHEEDATYEIVLYYDHNRACTIYRSWEDFRRLYRDIRTWKGAPRVNFDERRNGRAKGVWGGDGDLVMQMHLFLKGAIRRRPGEVSLEFFLRRRMGDCCVG